MDNLERAEDLSNYKEISLDRNKYFKSEYETLPIPDMDIDYFHKQNTIEMMDYSSVLGAIFISYKQDIYILEKDQITRFFQKDENKVLKKIPILKPDEPVINMIKISPCNHMMAVVVENEIRIYSVKDMIAQGTANLLSTFQGQAKWEYLRWAPEGKEPSDMLLPVDAQKNLQWINFQTGESKTSNGHKIICANFSRNLEHIAAITDKNELVIFPTKTLVASRVDKIEFLEEEFAEATVLTNIEEIKPDLWIIQGTCNENPDDPTDATRPTYMIQGNIVATNINQLKIQWFPNMFMPMYGADMPEFLPTYFKTMYIPQRDVFLSGNSEGMIVTMIIGTKPNLPANDPARYPQLEPDSEGIITVKTTLSAMEARKTARLRGYVFYLNKVSDTDVFEYLENDEERTMPYPPSVIVLTSCGQLAKYGFVDKRAAFSTANLLIDTAGVQGLKRNIQLKNFKAAPAINVQPAKPVVQPSQPVLAPIDAGIRTPASLYQTVRAATDAEEGIIDPHLAKFKNTKSRVKQKIELLTRTFQEIGEGIRDIVIEPLKDEDKKFYEEWRDIEIKQYKCKEFIQTSKLFLVKQKRFNDYFQGLLADLNLEAGMIREIITDQVLEGEEIKAYKNNELSLEIEKCKKHFDSFKQKFKFIKDFCQTYTNLESSAIIDIPQSLSESSSQVFSVDRLPTEESVHKIDVSLNMEPLSKSVRMSTALRNPEQQNQKLFKSHGLGGGSSLTRNKLSTKPINLQRSGLASSSVNASVRHIEPEYRKQLAELHKQLKEALQHSIQEINKIKSALGTLQDKSLASPSPVPHAKISAEAESILYKRNKRSRQIKFPENDEELNGYVTTEATNPFFASLLEKAQSSKLKTVKVPAFPFKRYDEYKGPKLMDIFADFQKRYKGIKTKDLTSQQSQFKQIFQAAPTEPQRVPAQRVEERKVDLSSRGATLADSKASIEDFKDRKTGFMDFSLSSKRETEAEKPKGGVTSLPPAEGKPAAPSSLFGGAKKDDKDTAANTTKPPSSLFGSAAPKEKEEPKEAGEKKEPGSIFGSSGGPTQTGKAPSSLFGGAAAPKEKEEAKAPGEKKEPGSIFGSSGAPTQTGTAPSSLFGGVAASKEKEEPKSAGEKKEPSSIFGSSGGPAQTSKAPSVLFGGAKDKTESSSGQQSTAPSSLFGSKAPGKEEKKKEEEKKNEDGDKSSSFIDSDDEGAADMGTILDKPPKNKDEKRDSKDSKDILSSLPGVKLASNFSFAPDPKKDLLKDILAESHASASDDDIPVAPVLVRDDSYLNKSEPAPKVDFFKTMTGRPPFLPPGKQEKKEDSLAQLRDFKNLTDKGPITLFTKKIEEKPKQTEEKKEQELSAIPENAGDDELFDSLSLGQPKKQAPPQQNKPPLDLTGGQKAPIIAQPVANQQAAGQDKAPQTQAPSSFFGSKPAQPTEQKPASTSNWGFFGANKDQNQPAQPSFGFGISNQQTGQNSAFQAKPNMFAIPSKDNAGQNQGSTGPTFGVSQFGSHGSAPAFGGATAFSKPPTANPMGSGFGHTSSFGAQQQQQAPKFPSVPQTTKLFGSGSSGASAPAGTGNAGGAPSSGGMLFSSATQNQGSSGFLGSGSNQANLSFGGNMGMNSIRKTKMT